MGETFYTLYLHMQSPPDVNLGEQVQGGKTNIGKVGDTGKAFGCHTHFEIRYFPERLSAWGNIYGKGDQRNSEYFKLNWGDPFVFFSKYPKGLVLAQANKRSNEAVINLPEFLGIYAVSKGDLIELKSHPQSSTRGFTIGGADILRSLSGVRLPKSMVKFIIIYQQGVASLTELHVKKIARVRREITYDFMTGKRIQTIKDFDRAYYIVVEEGFRLRLAPISKNPQMMVRAVPEKPLEGGIYALMFGGGLYDFVVEGGGGEGCVDRIIGRAGQVSYRSCEDQASEPGTLKKGYSESEEEEKISLTGPITIASLTKGVKGANSFTKYSQKFNADFSTIWNIVLQVLKKELGFDERKIVESDQEKGVVVTDLDLKLNGFFGPSTYDKYYIIVEKTNDKSTTVNFKFITYTFDKPKRPTKTFVNKKTKKFLELIEKELIGGKQERKRS